MGANLLKLTYRFYVVVRLFNNRSQMTSKLEQKSFTDVHATFLRLPWSITEQTHGNVVSFAAVIRVVTQRFSPTGEALRDDPNNGCDGD